MTPPEIIGPGSQPDDQVEIEKYLGQVLKIVRAIDEVCPDDAVAPRWDTEIPCPSCSKPLIWGKATSYNDHRHAECRACGWGFVE